MVRGSVDGGWWPRSLELAAELPALLNNMHAAGFHVTRIAYNAAFWDSSPCQLIVSGRLVHLDADFAQDAASINLIDDTGLKPALLVVIPPHTDPVVAENALVLAGCDGDLHRPDQILSRAERQGRGVAGSTSTNTPADGERPQSSSVSPVPDRAPDEAKGISMTAAFGGQPSMIDSSDFQPTEPVDPGLRAQVRLRNLFTITSHESTSGREHHMVTAPKHGPDRGHARRAIMAVLRRAEQQHHRVSFLITFGDYTLLPLGAPKGYDAGRALVQCRIEHDDPYVWLQTQVDPNHQPSDTNAIIGVQINTWPTD